MHTLACATLIVHTSCTSLPVQPSSYIHHAHPCLIQLHAYIMHIIGCATLIVHTSCTSLPVQPSSYIHHAHPCLCNPHRTYIMHTLACATLIVHTSCTSLPHTITCIYHAYHWLCSHIHIIDCATTYTSLSCNPHTIDITVLRGYETAANTDSIRRFLKTVIASIASIATLRNLSRFTLFRVFLGSLSYQWTGLSLYKGQEQPDL